jgi:hypothetical protein
MRKLYEDFDPIPPRVRVEAQQRMLIEAQLGEYPFEAWISSVVHGRDCNGC